MLPIIDGIITVAKGFFSLITDFNSVKGEKREHIADYFFNISACLADAYEKLSMDEVPHGRCSEIDSYADMMPDIVKGAIKDKDKIEELQKRLQESYRVERLWYEIDKNPELRGELTYLAEASGIFLAMSNSIRAGYEAKTPKIKVMPDQESKIPHKAAS